MKLVVVVVVVFVTIFQKKILHRRDVLSLARENYSLIFELCISTGFETHTQLTHTHTHTTRITFEVMVFEAVAAGKRIDE